MGWGERGTTSLTTEHIGELVGGDGEQEAFEPGAVGVVVGQAGQETHECFLYDVLTGGAISNPALDECQQPTLVTGDQFLPGFRAAFANAGHQQLVSVFGHTAIMRREYGVSQPGNQSGNQAERIVEAARPEAATAASAASCSFPRCAPADATSSRS